jgi:hypothetical protein
MAASLLANRPDFPASQQTSVYRSRGKWLLGLVMSSVMRSTVEAYEFVPERGEEHRSVCLAETIHVAQHSPRKSTVAISAAFLVVLSFIGLALLLEPQLRPADEALQLRASLTDFSCTTDACASERR